MNIFICMWMNLQNNKRHPSHMHCVYLSGDGGATS